MASFIVPQFLDSGDKIFFTMNIRQLSYFLGAFGISAFIYSAFNGLFPGVGVYAIIPCLPIIGIGAYLSLGHFNGRESEVYVFKIILFFLKPRLMKFKRQPDYYDIIQKYAQFSYSNLNKKYSLIDKKGEVEADSLISKANNNSDENLLKQIKIISSKVDDTSVNSVIAYKKASSLNQRRLEQIKEWNKIKKKK
jgi:PrgI family protein